MPRQLINKVRRALLRGGHSAAAIASYVSVAKVTAECGSSQPPASIKGSGVAVVGSCKRRGHALLLVCQ